MRLALAVAEESSKSAAEQLRLKIERALTELDRVSNWFLPASFVGFEKPDFGC
jgi:hypothetical protein